MTLVGYGVMVNGEPKGIWPIPLSECGKTVDRYRIQWPHRMVIVVPVYAGDPISAREMEQRLEGIPA